MSKKHKTYEQTFQIHKFLDIVKAIHSLNFNIEGDKFWAYRNTSGELYLSSNAEIVNNKYYVTLPAIEESQIRQILVGLEGVLGSNPEWVEMERERRSFMNHRLGNLLQKDFSEKERYLMVKLQLVTSSQAEALCSRWLDGLRPMFEKEPEKVLTELLEILKKLNK
jgi:hypothetical protein